MFKPVLKWIVRLLPFAAAMVASVAIGASTRAMETPEAAPVRSVVRHAPATAALQSVGRIDATSVGAEPFATPLLARADTLDLLAPTYPVGSLDTALTAPASKPALRRDVPEKFEWPRPDRWTSLLATLALGAFFFLRRIV
jgi:hypothetical protein